MFRSLLDAKLPVTGAACQSELRRRFREYCRKCELIHAEWAERGYQHPPPKYPQFPEELRSLACGAKTRAGTPCKRVDIYSNGRCKFHGGLSTGPTTEKGKHQAALNGFCPKRKRTP